MSRAAAAVSAAAPARARGLAVDEVAGAAARAGVRAGDRIVAIDGRPPEDVLDLDARRRRRALQSRARSEATVASRRVSRCGVGRSTACRCATVSACRCAAARTTARSASWTSSRRACGRRCTCATTTTGSRSCRARSSPSPTSTSTTCERIAGLRLSPLYVSLHAWDDDVRARLMGAARGPRPQPPRLARRPRHPDARAGGAVPRRQRRRGAARDGRAARRAGRAAGRRPGDAGAGDAGGAAARPGRAPAAAWSTWASCRSRWRARRAACAA